jgi:hypothetical protein
MLELGQQNSEQTGKYNLIKKLLWKESPSWVLSDTWELIQIPKINSFCLES